MLLSPFSRFARAALRALSALPVLAAVAGAQPGSTVEEPPLSALVDSAGLVRALTALPVPELPSGMLPIFIVSFDSSGAVKQVEPLGQLPASYADPVVAAIRAHLRPQAASGRAVDLQLRAVAGPEPLVERAQLVRVDPPRLSNDAAVAGEMERVIASFVSQRGTVSRAAYRAEVSFRVLEDGSVDTLSIQVSRSTEEAGLDHEAARIARVMRFRPATAEGRPVKVRVAVPLTFRMPREALGASALVDSAALAGALAGLSVPELPSGVRPLFRMGFDSTGAVANVEPVFDQIPADYAETVVAAIRASARSQLPPAPGRRLLDAYLFVVTGSQPAIGRSAVAEQRPVLENQREVDRMVAEARHRFGRRPERWVVISGVELRVLADGTVDPGSVRVQVPSGEPELDREALAIAARMRYRPAMVEGIAVPMRIFTPVSFWLPGQ